jgi:hypothetical protein
MKCLLCADREPDRPAVCDPCRLWLPTVLRDIDEGYATLTAAEPAEPAGILIDDDGTFNGPAVYDVLPLPAGPIRATVRGAHVSGSRDAPVPVTLDHVDLTAPARVPNPVRGPGWYPRSLWPEDQVGHQPVATRLDQWVRDWRTYPSCPGDMLPTPSVPVLVGWLTVRLGWACDRHPAVDEFAGEMRAIRSVLRTINDGRQEQPELCDGVPCKQCDLKLIYRTPNGRYPFECDPEGRYGGCQALMTEDEYRTWTRMLAASAH